MRKWLKQRDFTKTCELLVWQRFGMNWRRVILSCRSWGCPRIAGAHTNWRQKRCYNSRRPRERLMKNFVALVISIFVCAGLMQAQAAPQQAAAKKILIHAGRLLDVKTGKMLTNQSIYIEG